MTIVILFQQSHHRTFKASYSEQVQRHLRNEFPQVVSYSRFVELMQSVLVPLAVYRHTRLGECSGIRFIDSTALAVCRTARIRQHRVFALDARRGKTSVGPFYGRKLHVVVDDRGELLASCLSRGNLDDRRPVPRLVRRLFGKRFGDRGHISQALAEALFIRQGLSLITKLRKQAIIETIDDQLKNICHIEHSSHRTPATSWSTCLPASSPPATNPRNPPWI